MGGDTSKANEKAAPAKGAKGQPVTKAVAGVKKQQANVSVQG
jgi:hypothetical protein